MANTDNKCCDLLVEDHYSKSTTHLADIYNLQKNMQENLFGFRFEEMTLQEIKDYWLTNSHADTDETHEMFDALGGINDGIGNAVWKHWKKDHEVASKMKVKDLSESDLKELKMEIIDKLHFFLNWAISISMSPQDLYNMYISKNKENWDRQKRGY